MRSAAITITPRMLLIGLAAALLTCVAVQPALADTNQDLLARYHQGYGQFEDQGAERKATLALVGYGAKQGLIAAGVDYRQTKQALKRVLVHSLTNETRLIVLPTRINLQSSHLDGTLVTELIGRPDGEVGFAVKLPF